MGEQARPVVITQSEYMRRMKDMSRYQSGMAFYGQMPDMYNLVLNANHPLINAQLATLNDQLSALLSPITAEIKGLDARLAALRQQKEKANDDEKKTIDESIGETEKLIQEQKDKKNAAIADKAKDNAVVHQLIDLALLQNGLLRGEALDRFLQRSVELISE